jgi:hypothetical protein
MPSGSAKITNYKRASFRGPPCKPPLWWGLLTLSGERIPIIDPNKRGGKNRPLLYPAKQERYKIRTTVERSNSHLKGSFIPRDIFVKGYTKISCVLMSAAVCLPAIKYLLCFLC